MKKTKSTPRATPRRCAVSTGSAGSIFEAQEYHDCEDPAPTCDHCGGDGCIDYLDGDGDSTTMSKPAEVQTLPSTHYWPLFEHMLKEHGLTLTDSEMHEIVQICRQLERVVRHGTERPHQH